MTRTNNGVGVKCEVIPNTHDGIRKKAWLEGLADQEQTENACNFKLLKKGQCNFTLNFQK